MLVYICVYMLFFFIHMNIYTTIVYSTSQLVRVNSNVGSTGLYFDQHFIIIFFGLFPISLPMYLVIIIIPKLFQ